MSKKIFSYILEFVWFIVGVAAGASAINALINSDSKNGYLMLTFSVVGFAMFYFRRRLRKNRHDD